MECDLKFYRNFKKNQTTLLKFSLTPYLRALDEQLSPPGSGKPGTNPEQLFAVGYSACFMGAMKRAGAANAIAVPKGVAIDASVSLGKVDGGANLH